MAISVNLILLPIHTRRHTYTHEQLPANGNKITNNTSNNKAMPRRRGQFMQSSVKSTRTHAHIYIFTLTNTYIHMYMHKSVQWRMIRAERCAVEHAPRQFGSSAQMQKLLQFTHYHCCCSK